MGCAAPAATVLPPRKSGVPSASFRPCAPAHPRAIAHVSCLEAYKVAPGAGSTPGSAARGLGSQEEAPFADDALTRLQAVDDFDVVTDNRSRLDRSFDESALARGHVYDL